MVECDGYVRWIKLKLRPKAVGHILWEGRILTAFVFPNTMFLPDGCKLGSKSLNPILQNLRGRIGWYL